MFETCFRDPRISLPHSSPESFEQARSLLADCQAAAFYDWLEWIGLGLLLLTVATGVLYGVHPWWMSRRRLLSRWRVRGPRGLPLIPPDAYDGLGELVEFLDRLRHEADLARPPCWLINVHAWNSANAVAYGLPGRRRIVLDLGLAGLYFRDRDRLRAVLLHELAHLRHGDVDRTYAAIAVGWAFLAVGVGPFAVLTVHRLSEGVASPYIQPEVLPYLVETPFALGTAAGLTLMVYLVRNGLLRTREIHADAFAARLGASDGLVSALSAQQATGRLRWGTHPAPQARILALGSVTLPSVAQLVGTGMVAGIFTATIDNIISTLFLRVYGKINTRAGLLAAGLVIGGFLAVTLVVAAWRSAEAGERTRGWVPKPLALIVGFAAGASLPLLTAQTELPAAALEVRGFAWVVPTQLTAGIGALLITVWLRSTLRALGDRRRGAFAVAAVAVTAASWLFAVWSMLRLEPGLAPRAWRVAPPGDSIGWYRVLGTLTWVEWTPLRGLERSVPLLPTVVLAGLVVMTTDVGDGDTGSMILM